MAEYAYPPVVPGPGWWVVTLHVMLVCVALIPVVGLFLHSRRPAKAFDVFLWSGVLFFAPIPFGVAIANLSAHSRPFLLGLLAFTEIVSLLAVIISFTRLVRQGKAINAVMAIGGLLGLIVLVALLLPNVPLARQAAYRSQCRNNLKQLGLALHNYYANEGALPPATSVAENGVLTSWRVVLAPYFELANLSAQYDRTQTWDSDANLSVAKTSPFMLICPANELQQDEQNRYFSAYAVPLGPGTPSSTPDRHDLSKMDVAQSQTIAIVEACGRNIVWTKPEDVDMQSLPLGVNLPGIEPNTSHGLLSSMHKGGAHVVNLDGSVYFISDDIDSEVLRQRLLGPE